MPKSVKPRAVAPLRRTWRHAAALAVSNALLFPVRIVFGVALAAHFSDE